MVVANPIPVSNSVVKEPIGGSVLDMPYIFALATVADEFYLWGTSPSLRDRQLRAFWPTEPILASAIGSQSAKYAAFGWTLDGPPRTVAVVQKMLHNVERGEGWNSFIIKTLIDLFTQDNGAMIEIVRAEDSPDSPTISLNHLDSARCIRTGRVLEPITYIDLLGTYHKMKWYQVIPLSEMPSPVETARGLQYCVVTRMLRAAQILRDISVYKREKVSGRFNRAIHLVSGVDRKHMEDALEMQRSQSDDMGLTRYLQPLIVTNLAPDIPVKTDSIELASLPDGFDEEVAMRWYINQLALAFSSDYQDFAPLPAGNLGTSQQSQILHLKSRGKGPALFMSLLEHKFNFHGVMPNTVRFQFGDQDIAQDMSRAELARARASTRDMMIKSGEITPDVARQIAVDVGDLDARYLTEIDITPNIIAPASVPADQPVKADDIHAPASIPVTVT